MHLTSQQQSPYPKHTSLPGILCADPSMFNQIRSVRRLLQLRCSLLRASAVLRCTESRGPAHVRSASFSPMPLVVSTLAGDGTNGFRDGPGAAARFNRPIGAAVDGEGTVYVADHDGNRIRKISPDGVVSTLAGNGTFGFRDGPAPPPGSTGLLGWRWTARALSTSLTSAATASARSAPTG